MRRTASRVLAQTAKRGIFASESPFENAHPELSMDDLFKGHFDPEVIIIFCAGPSGMSRQPSVFPAGIQEPEAAAAHHHA